jgi:hypothetical protein
MVVQLGCVHDRTVKNDEAVIAYALPAIPINKDVGVAQPFRAALAGLKPCATRHLLLFDSFEEIFDLIPRIHVKDVSSPSSYRPDLP